MDLLLAQAGGVPPEPWEFEGLGTILSLVARGIGIAALPRLTLAAGERRVVVRDLPGTERARDVYAVARASSVRRPSIAAILTALHEAAGQLPGRRPVPSARGALAASAGRPGTFGPTSLAAAAATLRS